jgi:hypothetical protein
MFPKSGALVEAGTPFRALLSIYFGVPSKEPYPKFPFMESLAERCPVPRAPLHSSFKVPGIWAPSRFQGPQTGSSSRGPLHGASSERDTPSLLPPSSISQSPRYSRPPPGFPTGPPRKEKPVSRAFSTYPSGSPAREPSLQVPFTELPNRETFHPQSPFHPYLKVSGRRAHSRLPNWAPMKRDARPRCLPFITFRVPSKGAPLQVPLTEFPQREIHHRHSSPSAKSQSSW